MPVSDTIERSGFPLGFRTRAGSDAAAGSGVHVVEARKMASAHQKEAVIRRDGEAGAWRVVSDEGVRLGGTDLAPFPLGFFNAGLHADLAGHLVALAKERGIGLAGLNIRLKNFYSMTGSFFRGDRQGFAEPAEIALSLDSEADGAAISALASDAARASPALAAMRRPVAAGFALYVNGRRRALTTMPETAGADAPDPFATYAEPPAPAPGAGSPNPIRKTGRQQSGTATGVLRVVEGSCGLVEADGVSETETWLALPGASHFTLRSDERPDRDEAPGGLALLSAGLAFCFMTQLDRHIAHMKFHIDGVRLVQFWPHAAEGGAGPVDTHLFLNGREDEETYETLMRIAARSCYLHATLGASLEPRVSVLRNGAAVR